MLSKKQMVFLALAMALLWMAGAAPATAGRRVPIKQFNIGDSIGEGEAADNIVGIMNHEVVWSTGYDAGDAVDSINERFEEACPDNYSENNASRDDDRNFAITGSKMEDFEDQALEVVDAAESSPPGRIVMVNVFLGNNDVCASSLSSMTDPDEFEDEYRAGLDVLAASDATQDAYIHVTGIPAIYWLWEAKRSNDWCKYLAWPFVPCENLLDDPDNDCAGGGSHLDPDTIHPDDGPDCVRRKRFHAEIRDTYNPILRDVLQEYIDDGRLRNAYYVDIFDIQFEDEHVNDGDCFHPSIEGHALLAEEQWGRLPWGLNAPSCGPPAPAPWIELLILENEN